MRKRGNLFKMGVLPYDERELRGSCTCLGHFEIRGGVPAHLPDLFFQCYYDKIYSEILSSKCHFYSQCFHVFAAFL